MQVRLKVLVICRHAKSKKLSHMQVQRKCTVAYRCAALFSVEVLGTKLVTGVNGSFTHTTVKVKQLEAKSDYPSLWDLS